MSEHGKARKVRSLTGVKAVVGVTFPLQKPFGTTEPRSCRRGCTRATGIKIIVIRKHWSNFTVRTNKIYKLPFVSFSQLLLHHLPILT